MANFCLECWNAINETNYSPRKYIFSKTLDLCEGCGKQKYIIVIERKSFYLNLLQSFIFPFKFICTAISYILYVPLILSHRLFKYLKKLFK